MTAEIIAMPKHGPLVAKKLQTVFYDLGDRDRCLRQRDQFMREFHENQRIYIRALEALRERWKQRGYLIDADIDEFYRIWAAQTEDFQLYIYNACPQDWRLDKAVTMLIKDRKWLTSFTHRLLRLERQARRAKLREADYRRSNGRRSNGQRQSEG
jgi:hypothetical protein